jgi:hypothetical protein
MNVLRRTIDWFLASGIRLAVASVIALLVVTASAIGGTSVHYGGVRAASSELEGTNARLSSENSDLQNQITKANARLQLSTAPIRNKLKRQKATAKHLSSKVVTLKGQLRRVKLTAQARYQSGWNAGHKAGYDEGHSAGYDEGLAAAVDASGLGDTYSAGCDPNYTGCVPDYDEVGDVDCADVDGPVEVIGADPHGLDGDGDGIACEY